MVFFRYTVATDCLDLASKLKSLPVMSKFSSKAASWFPDSTPFLPFTAVITVIHSKKTICCVAVKTDFLQTFPWVY